MVEGRRVELVVVRFQHLEHPQRFLHAGAAGRGGRVGGFGVRGVGGGAVEGFKGLGGGGGCFDQAAGGGGGTGVVGLLRDFVAEGGGPVVYVGCGGEGPHVAGF